MRSAPESLRPEESSNAGRLDMALRFNGQIDLFEFKVVKLEPEGRALSQEEQNREVSESD